MQPVRPAAIPFTYEDYAALPGDGRRWEVIDGGFEANPSPSARHQTVSRRLQFELMKTLEEPGLALVFNAPFDVILDETNVVQPLDQRVKKGLYARFGISEYWLVDPKLGHIEQHRLEDGRYVLVRRFDRASRLTTPSFQEVDIDLAHVFR